MATRKAKMSFAIKRFKGFWNQFKRSKRGITGIIIVMFFSLVAIFAPLIAPYAPMEPMNDVGKYPACGPFRGPKIAEKLCVPEWYKYIPWILKGPTQAPVERFWVNLTELGGQIFVQFGRIEERAFQLGEYITKEDFDTYRETAIDDYIRLEERAIERPRVEVIYPNYTSIELALPAEWWQSRSPDVIGGKFGSMRSYILSLNATLGQDLIYTIFKVTYEYSGDLTQNMELVRDFQFSSNRAFDEEWNWTTYTDSISVKYNSTKGYNNDGCIEITCNPKLGENESKVVLWKKFEYPYWQAPKSFWGHLSLLVEGMPKTSVNLTPTFQREEEELIPLVNFIERPSTGYSHKNFVSTSQEVWNNVGSSSPEPVIFPAAGKYTFAIEVVFNGENDTSVYLDNLNVVLYGNSFGLLGTDNDMAYPRDIFSTMVYGTRISLTVGVLSALFSTMIGLFLGLVSGYVGGITDEAIMRFADLFLVLPTLPLFIILVVALKVVYGTVSMWNIILVLTLFGWMGFARSVRSMVLSLRERPFIEAARAAGAGKFYIINRHLLPNVFALVYITLATAVPGAIVTEASLSWLGLGDPMVASWGKLLYDFNSSGIAITRGLTEYWFWIFPACISIALLATAFILMGYALDEILNPRLRMRR